MQTFQVFFCFDSKASAYMPPFFMASKGEAIRAFTDLVNDGQSTVSRYPEDFTLFHAGSWSDSTGAFELLQTPDSVIRAIELKKVVPIADSRQPDLLQKA
nr:MAG: nonstructural protein [Microvirus sp.]